VRGVGWHRDDQVDQPRAMGVGAGAFVEERAVVCVSEWGWLAGVGTPDLCEAIPRRARI